MISKHKIKRHKGKFIKLQYTSKANEFIEQFGRIKYFGGEYIMFKAVGYNERPIERCKIIDLEKSKMNNYDKME